MKATDLKAPKKEGAGCLIFSRDTDRFLLIERSEYVPMPLTWSLPGGGVDPGERPQDAARREVGEEIGFDLKDRDLKLIYKNDVHAPRFTFYTFACTVKNEFEPRLNYESSNYKWCDLSTMPAPLHWGLEQLINHDRAAEILKKFVDQEKDLHRKAF